MSAYAKPLPAITEQTAPYWAALRAHELQLCFCGNCNHAGIAAFRWCPVCGADQPQWRKASGRGEISSWGRFHQLYFAGFRDELPYNVILVRLDEGVRLYSNLVGPADQEIRIGQRVEAVFDDVTPEVTLLKFGLAGAVPV